MNDVRWVSRALPGSCEYGELGASRGKGGSSLALALTAGKGWVGKGTEFGPVSGVALRWVSRFVKRDFGNIVAE